jgi:predicted transcriptional regulator
MHRVRAFPREVESFIAYCIDSVEQVEILLLLCKDPARRWTIDELSDHLRSSPRSVGLRLSSLVSHGLVARDGMSFHYAASPADDVLVKKLKTVYEERRTTVIDYIFTDRVDPMRSFADAFRIGEDGDG